MEQYIRSHHLEDIVTILESPKKAQIHEILLDLSSLKENSPKQYENLIKSTDYNKIANKWIKAIKNVQQQVKDELKGKIDTQINLSVNESKTTQLDVEKQISFSASCQSIGEDKNVLEVKQNIALRLCNHPNVDENFKLHPDKQFLKIVGLKAIIVKRHQPKTRIVTKQYMCSRCKNAEIIYANRYYGYGFVHGKCKQVVSFQTGGEDENLSEICFGKIVPVKYTPKKSQKTHQTQVYEVTVPLLEQHKIFGDKSYLVDVEGKLINAFEVGQMVNIIGVVKTRCASRRAKMKSFGIAALNIELCQKIDLSKDLTSNTHFRVLSAMHHDVGNSESELIVRNKIVESVFPKIYGAYAAKLAILLVVCSGSGKSEEEGNSKRDVFHLMLAGRNSAGKRTLLRAAAELTPKSNEVHSFGLTLSSLTARSFKLKKGGDNNIEAGVLLRSNDGIACFHDFECLKKKFRRVLHEIMETQRVKISSARLKANIRVSASIIAAQRIKRVRVKKKDQKNAQPITSKMFKIEESLLNRFDLILIMNEPKEDKNYKRQLIDMALNEAMGVYQEAETDWPRERITAHIAYAKTYGSIEFTPEVEAILRKYFFFCTINPNIPKWRTTTRMYEGLKRITAAHTRLMLRKKTKIFDAITTILLSELSYPLGYLLETTFELNDPSPGPDDESVEKILWLLKMPDDYYDIYEKEQSNMEDLEVNLLTWLHQENQPKEQHENVVEEFSIIEESVMDQKTSDISMDTTATLSLSASKKFKGTKKKVPTKTPQKNKKLTKPTKRKQSTICHESSSPKKSRLETHEPLINDAILANLSSLSKAFAPVEITQLAEINNGLDQEIEDELKALQEFNLFGDL